MPNQHHDDWPIIIISLPDAFERRQRITQQLNGLDLPFTIFNAIDGRHGLPIEYESMIDRAPERSRLSRKLSDAEYACALSHQAVYRQIIDDNLQGAIVLEDDAILTPLFSEFLAVEGYTTANLIQLDHLDGRVSRFGKERCLGARIRLKHAAANASLTTGYSISWNGAKYILQKSLPLRGTADWPCDITALGSMLALPRIVHHPDPSEENSYIEPQRSLVSQPQKTKTSNGRFFYKSYWKRWWFKRTTRRVS